MATTMQTLTKLKTCLSIAVALSLILAMPITASAKPDKAAKDTPAAEQPAKGPKKAPKAKNPKKGKKDKKKGDRADPVEPENPAAAIEAKDRHLEDLLARGDVYAVGVSWDKDGNAAIKVFQDKKAEKALGLSGLPKKLDKIPVIKQDTGRIYALNVPCEDRQDSNKCIESINSGSDTADIGAQGQGGAAKATEWHERPIPIGVSASAMADAPGTVGCRVSRGCHNYALTNAHVATATAQEPLIQPSAFDGGINQEDEVARLYESTQILLGTGSDVNNVVDAAIFQVTGNTVDYKTDETGYGAPKAFGTDPALAMDVMKYGRTSEMTHGYIDAIDATVIVMYPEGEARFVNQLIIRTGDKSSFSLPGDSGSLVVASEGEDERAPVGLLFASGKGISVANPIDEVLTALDIEIDGDYE